MFYVQILGYFESRSLFLFIICALLLALFFFFFPRGLFFMTR